MYGTLRRGFDNRYARLLDRSAEYLGTARMEGRLYNLGRYPGIRLKTGLEDWVSGEVFQLRNPAATLPVLDLYEGPEFARALAGALLANGERRQCWVYEYTLPVGEERRIVSGDFLRRPIV